MRSSLADGIGWLSGGLGYALPFLFVLGIVVFFHELGHFLMARWCGIRVLVFSIGFGPELIGFNDRYNTRWKVSAIPLGGYVKFFGDENAASTPDAAALATMSEGERRQRFFPQKAGAGGAGGGGAGSRGCGRSDCEFHPRNRHFRRDFHALRQGDLAGTAGGRGQSRERGG